MNTLGIEIADAVADRRREPLNFDAPDAWECVAEMEHSLKQLREDDYEPPPWVTMTQEQAIAEAEAELERYQEMAEATAYFGP